jgi:hypothetical protein
MGLNKEIGLDEFVKAIKSLGIEIELAGNYPWIYIDSINGKKVTEKFEAEHGFTVALLPIKREIKPTVLDIKESLKLICKYL